MQCNITVFSFYIYIYLCVCVCVCAEEKSNINTLKDDINFNLGIVYAYGLIIGNIYPLFWNLCAYWSVFFMIYYNSVILTETYIQCIAILFSVYEYMFCQVYTKSVFVTKIRKIICIGKQFKELINLWSQLSVCLFVFRCVFLIVISISGVINCLLPNYWFPDCIDLSTGSIQEVVMAQHMFWFLKSSYFQMLFPIYCSDFIPQRLIKSRFLVGNFKNLLLIVILNRWLRCLRCQVKYTCKLPPEVCEFNPLSRF